MDRLLFYQINSLAGQNLLLDNLAIFFGNNYFGYVLLLILAIVVFRNRKKYLPILIEAVTAGVIARLGIVEIFRLIWHRARPYAGNNVNLLFPHGQEYSIPSGHASFYFALSTIIYFYNKKLGIFFFASSFLICLARVFSGVHWPSDILAGAAVGIFSGWIIHIIFKKLKNKYEGNRKSRT